ncbi:MAG TPA: SurA N-terminal domain-containing protein [Terrimicrobiaceae bacterium]|nr:SurA N-terminal domain-containing protein [Terrimicrobiaceae bacterium]
MLASLVLGIAIWATDAWADPSPEELPPNVVAVVSHVPVELGTITAVEFHHALVQAAAAEGRRSLPKPGGKKAEILRRNALEERLDSIWVQGQASEMRISVTSRQVSRALALIKEESFRNRDEYRRFLKRYHYTRRDINERVELQLLATRIEERVVAGAGKHQLEAFEKFVEAYSKRWRARTVCAPEYVIDRCSNGPSPAP